MLDDEVKLRLEFEAKISKLGSYNRQLVLESKVAKDH
jgi:hypothetical protein